MLILVSSISLIVIVTLINPAAKERVVDKTLSQMNLLNNNKTSNFNNDEIKKKDSSQIYIFTKYHHEIYISAYKMFLDNKFLGVGVKNFRNFCSDIKYYVNQKEACNSHPHNTYLQILTETGFIGFLFLILILLYFLKYIHKHIMLKFKGSYYFNDFEICVLSGIAIYLWPLVPTGNFFNNWLSILMILNIPFIIWSRKSNQT